jgi:hypothetical protein
MSQGSYEFEVYSLVSFTRSGGVYELIDDRSKANLIPLPPLSHYHPTPDLFGKRLTIGGWSASRPTWLTVVPFKFIMPASRVVSYFILIALLADF